MVRDKAVMFDKSAFEAIKTSAHGSWFKLYMDTITPVLLREIIADLAKNEPGKASTKLVSGLAQKFRGSGGVVNMDWQVLCIGSLEGQPVEMRGAAVVPEPPIHMVNGEPTYVMGPTSDNEAIMRWADGEFSKGETAYAEYLRASVKAFEPTRFYGRVNHAAVTKRLDTLSADVDTFIAENTALVIDWVIDQLRGYSINGSIPLHRRFVARRWNEAGRPHLKDLAPYAHHVARTLLMLVIGRNHVPSNPTNRRQDAEYLLYLPFCHVFVSDDGVHKALAPMLLGPYQEFLTREQFLARVAQAKKP